MLLEKLPQAREKFLEFYKTERNTDAYKNDKSYALLIESKFRELENKGETK
jgi:hypothetical protein